jgi:hypothetical protein
MFNHVTCWLALVGAHRLTVWFCWWLRLQVRMTSYASRNPYMSTPGEVMKDYGIEWDRRLVTTLGVANNRLYELRMQSNSPTYDKDRALLDIIRESFTVKEVEE